MGFVSRALITVGLMITLIIPAASASDRISAWHPIDMEQLRKSYEISGTDFPEESFRARDIKEREWHEELLRQLAPVKSSIDRSGRHVFEGRILEVIPPVDPSAPRNNPDHWPKIVFEAYGKSGMPKSRKPAIISMQWLTYSANSIDTVADFSRLLSNHHEIMKVEFGSPRHRQAIFAALDPDGSMGLPRGGAVEASGDIKEGALMVFAKQGIPRGMIVRMELIKTNPIDPILLFEDYRLSLPYSLIEEYARSMKYPTSYEPAYGRTAKAALQIFYTLSLAVPDLTSPQYQSQAKKYHIVGASTYRALSDALGYRITGGWEYHGNTYSLLPVTGDDVRRAALDVLVDGPVVPSPLVFSTKGGSVALIRSLMQIIEKDQSLAPAATKVLERHLAPEPGEDPDITALYDIDREQNRIYGLKLIYSGLFATETVEPAAYSFARIGWGEEKEVKEIVRLLLHSATYRREGYENWIQQSIAVLRLIARPEKYTRKDREKFGNMAANELEERITEYRNLMKRGFGSPGLNNFLEQWDAGNE